MIIRLASTLIMTRLLAPEMFGLMTIAAMANTVLTMMSDVGLNQGIVQSRRGEEGAFLDTAWTVQIIRGALLWLTGTLLAGLLYLAGQQGLLGYGNVYASPVLPAVLAITSISLLVAGFSSTRMAIAERRLQQRRLVSLGLASQICGLATMVAVALVRPSVWSLTAGMIASTLTTVLLSHVLLEGPHNRLRLDRASVAELIHFGKWLFLSSAVTVLAINGDRLLLGAYLDPRTLGVYSIAAALVLLVDLNAQKLVYNVSMPALSEVARRDPARIRSVYYRLRLPADLLLFFAAGTMFMTGEAIVRVLYDERYADAGSILSVLSLSLVTTRFTVTHHAFMALGFPRAQAIVNVVRCIALYLTVPVLFALYGVSGAVWGVALHGLATAPFLYRYKARLGLIDPRLEAIGLIGLPAGLLAGHFACGLWSST